MENMAFETARDLLAQFINDYRRAVGREPLCVEMFTDQELAAQDALIMANAPYGIDPWSDGALPPEPVT